MSQQQQREKIYIDANNLLNDSFLLAERILATGFMPSVLIALWRGGTPVGIAVQELFAYKGVPHEHYPVKTRHYTGIEQRRANVSVEGLELVLPEITAESRVLIVDDVFDTGLTLQKVADLVRERAPVNPANLKIATIWYKPANNKTTLRPDYFLHQTDRWIVFPHELLGLEKSEILRGKPELPALKNL